MFRSYNQTSINFWFHWSSQQIQTYFGGLSVSAQSRVIWFIHCCIYCEWWTEYNRMCRLTLYDIVFFFFNIPKKIAWSSGRDFPFNSTVYAVASRNYKLNSICVNGLFLYVILSSMKCNYLTVIILYWRVWHHCHLCNL